MNKDSAPAMPSGTAYLIGRLHRLVRLRQYAEPLIRASRFRGPGPGSAKPALALHCQPTARASGSDMEEIFRGSDIQPRNTGHAYRHANHR